ncbi:MAG: beta-ketoacyl synthase N-terminal-like domain-containing protein, partial [Candidatus Thermoplasmatota archaeon]|nr:beta-ketoacyl synthase N-terminal-like domain-containing protein [Candidatus Thermoplasmatota archaeon]
MTTEDEPPQDPFEPIAVIGVAALFPDAPNLDAFWANILSAKISLKEVPEGRWDVGDFWVEGGPKNVDENKTYSKIGGWVEDFEFDWRRWKIPPGSLNQIDDSQLWAVTVSAAALEHAGYLGDGSRELPKSRTGVIFANALGGENRNLSNHRIWADQFARHAVESGGMPTKGIDAFKAALLEGLPKVTEDTMPGELANVVSGRVANLLDLQGPNYSTDAACASTFAAILDACRLLHTRQVDMMVAGASDRTMDPATFAKFSAIGALSPSHSTPFDSKANGFVMGEGSGALTLKRLSDAIRDGDTIQAVIRGVGASSDGRGKGITAPSTRGQIQAVSRAYMQAGYDSSTVDLIEAHGTSTVVGDATELNSLSEAFRNTPVGETVAVGSIKSQIGHLKAAAGIAGLIKAIRAVETGTIPPSAGFSTPNENFEWNSKPFYVPTKAKSWKASSQHPRRAGISSFGFGGTNFHCAIESFDIEYHTKLANEFDARRVAWLNPSAKSKSVTPVTTMTHSELKQIEGGVLLANAETLPLLQAKMATLRADLFSGANFDNDPMGKRLSNVLPEASRDYAAEGVRCAIVATDWAQLAKRFDLFESSCEDRSKWDFLAKQMVMITDTIAIPKQAKVAHLYPGQGSQYVGMTLDLSKRYKCIGETWDEADKTMVEVLDGETLSSFVLRENLSEQQAKDAELKLKQTEYTQPAMLTADLALYRLLKAHGLEPDMVAGHSLGEYAALMVAGILNFDDALRAVAARGTEMGSVNVPDCGI